MATLTSAREDAQAATLRGRVVGAAGTDLHSTIEVPWEEVFELGAAIDAVTGGKVKRAVKPFVAPPSTKKETWSTYSFVEKQSDLSREIDVSASGSYNVEGVTVSASTRFLQRIEFSELSITLIARYQSLHKGYDTLPSYELTDEAKQYLKDHPADTFRDVFGDYFVAGAQRGSRFTAVYQLSAATAKEMTDFQMSLAGQAPEVFTAQGAAALKEAASQHSVSITVNVFMEADFESPPPKEPTNPEQVIEVLDWFEQNDSGIELRAELQHYSLIDASIHRKVSVDRSAFIELKQLYRSLWDVRARYWTCPSNYRDELEVQFDDLDVGIPASKSELATEVELRLEYQQKADRLLSKLNDVFDRMDFYSKVKQRVKDEPAKDEKIYEGTGQQIWMYGFSTYTKAPGVVIQMVEENWRQDWHDGWREHTFEFGPDDAKLVVGWEVISNWNDGYNGGWWKALDQNLLNNHAAVHVTSLHDRGFDWTVRFFYVDARDYKFE